MTSRLIAAALLLSASAAGHAETSVLRCGKLFDARSGRTLGAHTVVVREGRIAEVVAGRPDGPGYSDPGAKDTTGVFNRFDFSERTCSPGWTDLHVHLTSQSSPNSYSEGFRLNPEHYAFRAVGFAEKTLNAGFTSVRDLGGEVVLALRDSINQGLVRGPRIYAAGKSIATTGGHADPSNGINARLAHLMGPPGPTDGVVNSPDEARRAVRQRYKDGSDVIKITATGGVLSYAKSADAPQFTEDEIAAVVATAKDYGYRVAAHAHGKEGMKRAVLAGVTSIEHGTMMDKEVMNLMKQHGTWYVPTISAGRFVAEKAKIDGYFPEIVRPKAIQMGAQIQRTFATAYQAGVKIGFGTDMGVGPHGDNAREFLYMVEAGMPAGEALQAATIRAAEVLGVDDQGVIEVGKRADIIALGADPAADINAVLDVQFVMKDGVVYKD
ncbi:metal-dependent hydrolase family protein [Chiayiivirga flava]|uniref:Imidazolonepropionase-like amidohydrolase n=1 Tax=Chiayiivirga flava TaxID=659595 RepID=A0A7W8D5Y7_9GAMM|nr:amidohydrolase family protein [Chiayiivirga flava]MBB5208543.1 imidazolonepropionase-like amidohydrolase [Chiayiivirga flava]